MFAYCLESLQDSVTILLQTAPRHGRIVQLETFIMHALISSSLLLNVRSSFKSIRNSAKLLTTRTPINEHLHVTLKVQSNPNRCASSSGHTPLLIHSDILKGRSCHQAERFERLQQRQKRRDTHYELRPSLRCPQRT